MRLQEKVKVINLQPFPVNVWVVLTNNLRDSINQAYRKLQGENSAVIVEDDDHSTGAMTLYNHNDGNIYIILRHNVGLTHIAHETYHAVIAAAKFCGIKDEEFKAYCIGYLTNTIHEFVKEKNGKRKDKHSAAPSKKKL